MEIGVVMRSHSATPIVFFLSINYDFFRQERISIANNGCNIKIIPNIATHN
jgi:hypothetical protein